MADFDSSYVRAVQHPDLPFLLILEAEFGATTMYVAPEGAGATADSCRAWFELKAQGEGLDVEWVPYGTPQAEAIADKHFGSLS